MILYVHPYFALDSDLDQSPFGEVIAACIDGAVFTSFIFPLEDASLQSTLF